MIEREGGGYYFARRNGLPVELTPGQSLSEGGMTSAMRPWGEGKRDICC